MGVTRANAPCTSTRAPATASFSRSKRRRLGQSCGHCTRRLAPHPTMLFYTPVRTSLVKAVLGGASVQPAPLHLSK